MTPIERLKLPAVGHSDAREQSKKIGVDLVRPWAAVLGILLLIVGRFMANYRLNDWLGLPIMLAGGIWMAFSHVRPFGER